jgi:hypothetical protein
MSSLPQQENNRLEADLSAYGVQYIGSNIPSWGMVLSYNYIFSG